MKDYREIEGWLFDEEAELLEKYSDTAFVLELGSYKGKSTVCLQKNSWCVFCVDTFQADATTVNRHDTLREFLLNTTHFEEDRDIRVFPMTTDEFFANYVPKNYCWSLIFVDADHSYESCKKDVENSLNHLTDGGYLIMHDAFGENGEEQGFTPWPGVTKVYKELLNKSSVKFVEKVRRCAVFQKVL
jgi:predicted O-methyltransferase YrrM